MEYLILGKISGNSGSAGLPSSLSLIIKSRVESIFPTKTFPTRDYCKTEKNVGEKWDYFPKISIKFIKYKLSVEIFL